MILKVINIFDKLYPVLKVLIYVHVYVDVDPSHQKENYSCKIINY